MTPPELYAYLDGMGISYEVEEHAPVFVVIADVTAGPFLEGLEEGLGV